MLKRFKITLSIILSTIAIVLIGGYVYLSTMDYSRFKGLIETAVSDATGRKFEIAGDLGVSLSLNPQLVTGDVTLANASWGSQATMLTIGELTVGVKLLPLIVGDMEFTDIQFADIDLLLETDASGQGNWSFAIPDRSHLDKGFSLKHLGLNQLNVKHLAATFVNGKTRSTMHYTVDRLELNRSSDTDSMSLALKGSLNGQAAAVSGQTGSLFMDARFPVNLSGDVAGVTFKLKGEIGNLLQAKDLNLAVQASGTNLVPLGTGIDLAFPQTDSFSMSAQLTGNGDAVTLSNAHGTINYGGVALGITGDIGNLNALEDLHLELTGSGNNLGELQAIAGSAKLPETGPFNVSGSLSGSAEALSLTNVQGDLRHHSVKLSVTGKVNDVIAFSGIEVNVKGSGNNLGELQAISGDTKLPETGPFTASARLTGNAQTLSLRDALTVIKQKDALLRISGKIANLQRLSGLDLSFKGSGKDFTELGPTFGTQLPDLGPFQISGQLVGSSEALDLNNVLAVIDQSDFSVEGQLMFGKRPKVIMQIESARIDFTRLMGEAEKKSKRETGEAQDPMFSNKPLPFNLLDAVDADIKLNARHIQARDAVLEFGKLALVLNTGELRFNTLEVSYKNTRAAANLNIRSGTPAQVALQFLVQDFDLGSFLREIHKTPEVEGHVDLAADLHGQGDSPHALMAALDGTTGAVIGKGHVPRLLDLLAEDLVSRVIPFWGHHERAGELDCGVIEFSITQGIATSKTFLMDTYLGYFKAEGDTNLGTEQINFLLIPKPRKFTLFNLSTKLRVTGSFNDPKVRPEAIGLVEKGAEDIFTLTLGPIGLLFPFAKLGADKEHPCDMQKLKATIDAIYH